MNMACCPPGTDQHTCILTWMHYVNMMTLVNVGSGWVGWWGMRALNLQLPITWLNFSPIPSLPVGSPTFLCFCSWKIFYHFAKFLFILPPMGYLTYVISLLLLVSIPSSPPSLSTRLCKWIINNSLYLVSLLHSHRLWLSCNTLPPP